MKILTGDIFQSSAKTLVNTVNCVGVMGKGIALEFKKRYPQMYKDYLNRCKNNMVKPGEPYYYSDLLGTSIINFPTKDDWRSQSNINYIIKGLKWFVDNYQKLNITSVAFPPLGCGNGGLLWEDVGPIMYKALSNLPIDIEVYAPYGTKRDMLTEEFLSDYKGISQRIGKRKSNLNKSWLCILEVLYQLNKNRYSNYIGRTMFQKLCYLLTIEGVDTNFKFKQASYGPFSTDAQEAFSVLANTMLIYEEHKGQMDAIFTTENYVKMRENNKDLLNKYQKIIDKVTDMFTRIKNTEQAELYSTIIYAYNDLKKEKKSIDEQELLNYILAWKNRWKNDEKLKFINEGIRDLTLLNYIDIKFVPGFVKN